VRQHGARECHADRCTRPEVPRTADDLARIALTDVDLAELQAVGVRMLRGFEHTADAEEAEVAVDVGDSDGFDAVDLARRDDEALRDLLGRTVDRHVLLHPADGDLHQNCLNTRRSFSQNIRMSGMPWRCAAMRSRPSPHAKPVHSSGSMPTFSNTAGS